MRKTCSVSVKTFVEKHIELLDYNDTDSMKRLINRADRELSAWEFEELVRLLDSVGCFTRDLREDMFWEYAYDNLQGLGIVHINDVPTFLKYVPSYGMSWQDRVELLAKHCKEVGITF